MPVFTRYFGGTKLGQEAAVKTKSETKHHHEGILKDVTGVKVDLGIIFED